MGTSVLAIQQHHEADTTGNHKGLLQTVHNPKLYLRLMHNKEQEIRNYKIRNLGQIAFYVVALHKERCEEISAISDELAGFHAPSECSEIAYSGIDEKYEAREADIIRHFGVTTEDFYKELNQRVCGRWMWENFA